jgi:hypothetical protein
MIINPTARGKRSEAKILSELVEAGRSVLIPWGEERYDLALDEGGRLVRIQCKTGILRGGCVDFKTCVADIRRPLGDGGYHGQIEAFAVYCPQTHKSYLVPIEAVPGPTMARLRIDPTRNGQFYGVRWARDFELTAERIATLFAPSL